MRRNTNLYRMIIITLFSAIIFLMAFTPIGFIRIGLLEPTLLMIPVAIGAVLLGPGAGAILGGVFGLASFLQCFGFSAFGTTLLGINPIFTFIGCMVPRVVEGIVCGYMTKLLAKLPKAINFGVSALMCALTNTVVFMSLLLILFGNTDYILGFRGDMNIFAFVFAFVGVQGLVEIALTTFITPLVATPLSHVIEKTRG